MIKNPLTSSERRGIIAVAALALLITGAGLWLSRCGRPETTVTPEEVEVLLDGSSSREGYSESTNDSISKGNKSKKRDRGSSGSKKKGNKSYRKRSHLDEHVDSE